MKKARKCKRSNKVYKNKQWFDKECLIKRKKLRLVKKALNRSPKESSLRQRFCNLKKRSKAYLGNLNVDMNENYFANLKNYIIQTHNLSENY